MNISNMQTKTKDLLFKAMGWDSTNAFAKKINLSTFLKCNSMMMLSVKITKKPKSSCIGWETQSQSSCQVLTS